MKFRDKTIGGVDAFGVDLEGRYYFATVVDRGTEIGAVSEPGTVLAKSGVAGERLFSKGSVLYLSGSDGRASSGKVCEVYQLEGLRPVLRKKINIRRTKRRPTPFDVLDFDPASERALLLDSSDQAGQSTWYLFNLKTQAMGFLGKARDYGWFLSEDIIGSGAAAAP